MSQKIINKVKQFSDCDNLQYGEVVVDINSQDPSISFIDEGYEEVKIRPVKDVSKDVERLLSEIGLKASAANLDATNAKLTDTTNRVSALETTVNLNTQTLTIVQTQANKNTDDIDAINDLLSSQVTEVSKLGGIVNDIEQNASAIEQLEKNLRKVSNKADKNAEDITELGNDIDDVEKDVNKNKTDIQTVATAVNDVKGDLKKVYRIKGKATVASLNQIPFSERSEGDVYNISATGPLQYGEDNKIVTVRKGDNVVWVSTSDSSGYWDTFMAPVEIPEDNYVHVVDGAKSNGNAYTMNNIIDAAGDTATVNRVTYYLVTAKGHASMDNGTANDRKTLPSYDITTNNQGWLNGFFLVDSDVNNRSEGSWQKVYNVLTGDEYLRFCIHDASTASKKSWTSWRRNITTEDININLLSDSFVNRNVIGALNELKANSGGAAGGETTIQTMGLKVMRTDDNNNIVSMTPDASNSYTLHADTDNGKCEDNLYMSVHNGTPNVLNLGVKKDAYLQKTTAELSNLFVVAEHKTWNNGGKKDDNDLLGLEVTKDKQVKFNLQHTPDNPITVIDGNYDGSISSINWVSTDKDGAGRVTYYIIRKDGIAKVNTGYPSQFSEGCLLMHFDAGEWDNIGINNRYGTFQIAVSMAVSNTASGKTVLNGRKAYRMRYDDPTAENPDNRSWTSWVYEELSDKMIDNEVNILTQKDLNWLGAAHNSEYRNAVSYYYIAPENYGGISRDGGILSKEEFNKGAWVIHYDVDGKQIGTFQQLISVATGDVATRRVNSVNASGEGFFGDWYYSKVDLTPYQTKEITPTNIYKANKATTVLAAFTEINNALQAIDDSIDEKLDGYQRTDVSIVGLTKTTVETCLAELASKVKVLESTVTSGSGDSSTIEPYVDERVFAFKVKRGETSWKKIPFSSLTPSSATDKSFGAAIEVRDYYKGELCENGQIMEGEPEQGKEPVSKIITLDAESLPAGTKNNDIVVKIKTENFVDEVFPYNGTTVDGVSYINNIDDDRYGNFLDLFTDDGLLWCFDNGAYFGLPVNPTEEQVAASAKGWGNIKSINDVQNRATAIGGNLATKVQAQKLFNDYGYTFKIVNVSGTQYLCIVKYGETVHKVGVWSSTFNSGRLGFWLADGGGVFVKVIDNEIVVTVESNSPSTVGCLAYGALYVMEKEDVVTRLVTHNSHDSVHLSEGSKYKVDNMETIIDNKLKSMFEMLVPVGTIIPYLPYDSEKGIVSQTTFVNSAMLVENGGNWAICDGNKHVGYSTPNLTGMAPVGVNGSSMVPNTNAVVSHSHSLFYKSEKSEDKNDGSLTPNGNRKGTLYMGSSASDLKTVMTYGDNNTGTNGNVILNATMNSTPGKYTWYLIRVR